MIMKTNRLCTLIYTKGQNVSIGIRNLRAVSALTTLLDGTWESLGDIAAPCSSKGVVELQIRRRFAEDKPKSPMQK